MITPVFRGRVSESGILQVGPQFEVWLSTLKGKEVDVIVREKRTQRSNQQNKYYWGVIIKMICEELGHEEYEKDVVHYALRLMFLGEEENKHGLKIPRSTRSLSTKEFIDIYTEPIKRWAVEFLCLRIPDPNEVEY
ncbi:MAG: hypothetical protein V1784_12845 [bacterium]